MNLTEATRVLNHDVRLAMIYYLSDVRSAGATMLELTEFLDTTPNDSKLYYHVEMLIRAGLVLRTEEAPRGFLRLTDAGVMVVGILSEFCDSTGLEVWCHI